MPTGTGEGALPNPTESYPVLDKLKATPFAERVAYLGSLNKNQQAAVLIQLIEEKAYDEERIPSTLKPMLKGLVNLPLNADRIRNFEELAEATRVRLLERLVAATESLRPSRCACKSLNLPRCLPSCSCSRI